MYTHRIFVIAGFIILATAVQAQDQATLTKDNNVSSERHSRVGIPLIVTNYLRCLDSDVPSIVESALGHVTYMRIAFPGEDLRSIQQKLAELTTKGTTRTIRYKAFTAKEVFGDPTAFQRFIEPRNGNGDGLLDEIGARILPQSNLVTR